MAWKPQINKPIGQNEHIGRRLFDEQELVGAQGQKQLARLSLQHFLDTRGEVSLDRLGPSGVEKAVVKYLQPRAERAGTRLKPPKAFNGWAVIRARQFDSPAAQRGVALSVVASPQHGAGLDENIYHAHIEDPPNFVDPDKKPYFLALHLRELFERETMLLPVGRPTAARGESGFWRLIAGWIRRRAVLRPPKS